MLVKLRESAGVDTESGAYYDANHVTNGTHRGVAWTITDASAGLDGKATAFLARLDETLVRALADRSSA